MGNLSKIKIKSVNRGSGQFQDDKDAGTHSEGNGGRGWPKSRRKPGGGLGFIDRRCIYCGYCSLICPTDCILLSFFVFFLLVSSFFSFLSKDFLFFSSFLFFVFLEL